MRLSIYSLLSIVLFFCSFQTTAQKSPYITPKPLYPQVQAQIEAARQPFLKNKPKPTDQNFRPEIVGGRPAAIEERPWQVALMDKVFGGQFCGGTIIDEYWIVTATHCLEGASPSQIQVLAGSTSVTDLSGGELVDVAEIHRYPNYVDVSQGNDITLLKLATPLDLSGSRAKKIGYITALDEANGLTDEGVMGIISGWGTLSFGGQGTSVLYTADVPVLSLATANALAYEGILNETMLAAGDIVNGGIDACQGDSGGPLVVPNAVGTGYLLAGVTSWGLGCGDADAPGIYARVGYFADWIAEVSGVVNNNFPQLIISEIVKNEADPAVSFIEIHNAGSDTYLLNEIAIRWIKPSGEKFTLSLANASLNAGNSYVLSSSAFDNDWGLGFQGKAPDQISPNLTFSGSDVIQLIHQNDGYVIDQYGKSTTDFWHFQNDILTRKSFLVYANNGDFNENNFGEWHKTDFDGDKASPGSHVAQLPANDIQIISISIPNNTNLIACNDDFALQPTIRIRNTGSGAVSSFKIKVSSSVGSKDSTYQLTSNSILAAGAQADYLLPNIDFIRTGEYFIQADVQTVNDQVDGNPTNNLVRTNFQLTEGYQVNFKMTFDQNADQNLFLVADSALSNVVYRGNNGNFFLGYNAGETYEESFCLAPGFYNFVFVDVIVDFFGFYPGGGLDEPGNAIFEINSKQHGTIEVANISGAFEELELYSGFKLPYEPITDARIEIIFPADGDLLFGCDDSDLTATIRLINQNSITITSADLVYEVNGVLTPITLTDINIRSGESKDIPIELRNLSTGAYQLKATINKVNGEADDNQLNDTSTSLFNYEIPTELNEMLLFIILDDWAEETGWYIANDAGQKVYKGQFTKSDNFRTFSRSICLPNGTFTFGLTDSFGDGGAQLAVFSLDEEVWLYLSEDYTFESTATLTFPFQAQYNMDILVKNPQDNGNIEICGSENQSIFTLELTNTGNVPVYLIDLEISASATNTQTYEVEPISVIQPAEKYQFDIPVSIKEGDNSITLQIKQLNERMVSIPSVTVTYTGSLNPDLNKLLLFLNTDDFPEETYFQMTNATGSIIGSGDNFTRNFSSETYEYCLSDGAYQFKLFDRRGDGGALVQLIDETTGFSFGQILRNQYGSSATVDFCYGCPEAPENFTAEAISRTNIRLRWQDKSEDETGFIIYRSDEFGFWSELIRTFSNTENFIDIGLRPGTSYGYRIRSFKTGGISSKVPDVSAATFDPLSVGSENQGFLIYPNPVKSGSEVQIKLPDGVDTASILVYDAAGKKLLHTHSHKPLSTQKLKAGIYQIMLNSKNETWIGRLIVID